MDNLSNSIINSFLFKNTSVDEVELILKEINYSLKTYEKSQVIAFEGDSITSIGIVIQGNVEIQKIYPSGKTIIITHLKQGDIFGEVIVFSNMKEYPSSIVSTTNSSIMFIPKNDILKICSSHTIILNNFMSLLSNKILMLNKKLKNLSYLTIREKLCSYLLEEYAKQRNLTIKMPFSRQEMSENFGVTRPSLSRELMIMQTEGLIEYNKNIIKICDLEKLETCLF